MSDKKANHQANIVCIGEILPHPNADKLEITKVEGYQIVVGKGNFKTGDLAVYIQPDSIVPQTVPFQFIWQDHLGIEGIVPEKRRRITVKRLRGEYSEGLLMPVTDFPTELVCGILQQRASMNLPLEGIDVADLLGVTHYVPAFDKASTKDISSMPRRKYPRSVKGWFFFLLHKIGMGWGACGRGLAAEVGFDSPIYDVDAYKNHRGWLPEGTLVQVTEKIHGSNGRAVVIDDVLYVGSHEQWKQAGDNVWWNAVNQHRELVDWLFQNQKKFVYFEVGPTQGDKWAYGATKSEPFLFTFDVYDPETNTWRWAGDDGVPFGAPILYVGPFNDDVLRLADGPSVVPGQKSIREGIVIRASGNHTSRGKLKVVSNKFLEKDSQ